jgi:hypothetical protein
MQARHKQRGSQTCGRKGMSLDRAPNAADVLQHSRHAQFDAGSNVEDSDANPDHGDDNMDFDDDMRIDMSIVMPDPPHFPEQTQRLIEKLADVTDEDLQPFFHPSDALENFADHQITSESADTDTVIKALYQESKSWRRRSQDEHFKVLATIINEIQMALWIAK